MSPEEHAAPQGDLDVLHPHTKFLFEAMRSLGHLTEGECSRCKQGPKVLAYGMCLPCYDAYDNCGFRPEDCPRIRGGESPSAIVGSPIAPQGPQTCSTKELCASLRSGTGPTIGHTSALKHIDLER